MGKRGPLKKSRLMGGEYLRAKAQADAARAREDVGQLLAIPAGLSVGASRRWQTLAPILFEDGRLTIDTRESLVTYVRLCDEADVLGERLNAEGVTLTTPHGVFPNPLAKVLQGVRGSMLRYGAVLGLDPTSRARLGAAGVIDARTPAEKQQDADFATMFG